jgi:glycosyltransferase involved in cell wall biosynthesis
LQDWAQDLDVIMAHNVLHMPFNLPLSLALRRMATSGNGPVVVSWAHDSPYLEPNYPEYLNDHPWNVLCRPHPNIHHVTISESRRRLFAELCGEVTWKLIHNGIDPKGFFYLDPKSVKLAEELCLFSRDLVLVQPSRITPRKNLELSIHIVRGIKILGYNILFIMTGAYDPHEARAVSYYRRLRYWIKELGMQDNIAILAEYRFSDRKKLVPDRIFIRDLYLMADMLLMTSRDEDFGLPLLEAGMIKLPIACTEIPPFLEVGEGVCFFNLDDPPLSIAGRIAEYLGRTNTHKMFRSVMRKYILDVVCRKEIMPFLRDITVLPHKEGLGGRSC